jgi:hypothetical protein
MPPVSRSFSFTLREVAGRVDIDYSVNEDPARWGFDLIGFEELLDLPRGFPVIEARTAYPAPGYRGLLGWVQVVSWQDPTATEPETTWIVPDVAPQAIGANSPYLTFGIDPVFFDAPATDQPDSDWLARAFLTCTPDLLMTPVVEPVLGLAWGYDIAQGKVTPKDLRPAGTDDWREIRKMLGIRLPMWTFGGDDWEPLTFSA